MNHNILIPTDGSDSAESAAERGAALADATGAELHALYVAESGLVRDESPAAGEVAVEAIDGREREPPDRHVARGDRRGVSERVDPVFDALPSRDSEQEHGNEKRIEDVRLSVAERVEFVRPRRL